MDFLEYYATPRLVKIRHRGLVAIHRGSQLALLAFIAIFYVWWCRGYQEESDFTGVVSVKVQGAGFLGDRAACPGGDNWPECGPYDAVDVVQPEQQRGAVFITTSMATTYNQTRGVCASTVPCASDADCPEGGKSVAGSPAKRSEFLTGQCTTAAGGGGGGNGTCLQAAWCPAEPPATALQKHRLDGTGDLTVFFRVDGTFLDFPDQVFDSGTNLDFNYNVFYLSDILAFAKGTAVRPDPTGNATPPGVRAPRGAFDAVVDDGAEIMLTAEIMQRPSWLHPHDSVPCNLDLADWKKNCMINLTFTRVDPTDPSSASYGYNFRFAEPTSLALPRGATRTLTKVWGTRIAFEVRGSGGRFDFMTLVVTVAAAIAIMKVASSIADLVLACVFRKSHWSSEAMATKFKVLAALEKDARDTDARVLCKGLVLPPVHATEDGQTDSDASL